MSFTHLQRGRVRAGVAVTATVLVVALASPATAGNGHGHGHSNDYQLTVMGTTDLHGNVLNWDYFKNAEYDDSAHNDIGLAKISTLVNEVRADRGDRNTLLIDAGDTIQGTPLAYYYAKIEPDHRSASTHPMAAAMNAIGYDAAALGNHEFNYGIDVPAHVRAAARLPAARRQRGRLDQTGLPVFPPYVHQAGHVPRRQAGQGRHPRPDQPGHRDLGQGQRRGAR